MEIKAIRTEADYLSALREVSALYEAKHYPIDPPDPIDAIKFRMDQSAMTVKYLVPYKRSSTQNKTKTPRAGRSESLQKLGGDFVVPEDAIWLDAAPVGVEFGAPAMKAYELACPYALAGLGLGRSFGMHLGSCRGGFNF